MNWSVVLNIYTLILDGAVAWYFFDSLFERRTGRITAAIYCLLSCGIHYLLDQLLIYPLAYMLYGLAFIPFLFINFKAKPVAGLLSALYLNFIDFTMVFLDSFIISGFENYYFIKNGIPPAYYPTRLIYTLFTDLIFVLIIYLSGKFYEVLRNENGSRAIKVILSMLPPVSAAGAITIIQIDKSAGIQTYKDILLTICLALMVLVNVLAIVIYKHVQTVNANKLEFELQSLLNN